MKRKKLPETERKQHRYEMSEAYRKKVLRFTLQFNPNTDIEARKWFEENGKSGAYLKALILKDKAETERDAQWEISISGEISRLLDKAVSEDYLEKVADAIYEDVKEDVMSASDYPHYCEDDIRVAIGKVLVKKIGIEY